MRTLQIAMYALLALAPIAACGGAVMGPLDENGCPIDAADWEGTATLSSGCDGAPQTLQVSGGKYIDGSGNPNGPYLMAQGVQSGMCIAVVSATVPCGKASYMLKVPAK